jgi:uncharacterized protein (DUF1015 family)
MVRIKPFAALRPRPEHAALIASVPYDVVSTEEARALVAGNPISFLHAIRPEIGLPEGTDPHDPRVYERAASEFERFTRNLFVNEQRESIYLYRQEMQAPGDGRTLSQTGIVACCHIDDYEKNAIRRHEKTRQDKEDDRTKHVLAQNANAEPVFFMYRDRDDLAALVEQAQEAAPIYDFASLDGVRHTVWRLPDAAPITAAFEQIPCVYVADGHHRTAAAARAGAQRRAQNKGHTGEEEYNWFLAVLFPASSLTILPYHRVVKDLGGLSPSDFLARLAKAGTLTPEGPPAPPAPGSVSVRLPKGAGGAPGGWFLLTFPSDSIPANDPIRSLDYEILSERVLAPILGIKDLRQDKRIDFVGGIRGTQELERRVDAGEAAAAFSMHPATIEQIMAIADAGAIMPPKSTWFEPKLRSGLLVHTLG